MKKSIRAVPRLAAIAAAGSALVFLGGPAVAHPHVWVSTQTGIVFENGSLAALRYTWLFDEMYTTSATEGLDKNRDGKLDATELQELTKVNIEGLKEFDYFTTAIMAGKPVTFGDPRDYGMELVAMAEPPGPQLTAGPSDASATSSPATSPAGQAGLWSWITSWLGGFVGRSAPAAPGAASADQVKLSQPAELVKVLALHMTLPLKEPIPAASLGSEQKGFQFSIGDQQMFIWFEPTPKDGLTIAPGAPGGCRTVMVEPELDEEQKKLQEAFGRLGTPSLGIAKNVAVVC